MLGRWIASRGLRGKAVVATKVAGPGNAAGDMRHIRGEHRRLDRANIRAACEASLRRLGTETIDLYQVHWAERAISTLGRSRFSALPADPAEVPIAETLGCLAELVIEGKVRAIGVCNESPWGAMAWLAAACEHGHPRIAAIQNGYSLLDRSFELGLAEIALREHCGLIAYSPLARGLLTGKYASDAAGANPALLARFSPARRAAVSAYAELAGANGLAPVQLALAFARQQPFTTSVLMAASRLDQLEANLTACDIVLPAELVKAVNAIHDTHPNPR